MSGEPVLCVLRLPGFAAQRLETPRICRTPVGLWVSDYKPTGCPTGTRDNSWGGWRVNNSPSHPGDATRAGFNVLNREVIEVRRPSMLTPQTGARAIHVCGLLAFQATLLSLPVLHNQFDIAVHLRKAKCHGTEMTPPYYPVSRCSHFPQQLRRLESGRFAKPLF
jgi:hypothetical protein